MIGSVVVTGAGNGIGASIARHLSARWGWVIGLDVDERGLNHLATELSNFRAVVGDVCDDAALEGAVVAAESVGPLSAWVNNAGITFDRPLHLSSRAEIDRTIAINLGGTVHGCRVALGSFLRTCTAGVIVNISSIHGQAAFPGWSAYDATKGAIDALTRSVCAEYGHLGIRCNAVAPGAVNTAILQRILDEAPDPDALLDDVRSLAPMRRVVEPDEVAQCVAWLLSPSASAVSGQVIAVDGGALARSATFPPNPHVHFDH
jgi:NAD(P)-dependent dehydrogenase (short-subunit alcohol dehydrogenase family)